MYVGYIKRGLDLILSVCALLVFAIPMAVIALIVKLDSAGPVFFKQERIGKGKKIFKMLKFRTMRTDAPANMPTHLLENPDMWITSSGRWLRKTSLDELPQILNIIKGDMALIGPRPALWNQYDLIEARDVCAGGADGSESKTVNDLRPGLTGLAQVRGRDELSLEEKVRYDREYLGRISFLYDCKIFLNTVTAVLKSDGVVEGKQNEKLDMQ